MRLALLASLLAPVALRAQGWVPTPTGAAAEYRALAPLGARVAWAAGSQGTVALTTDGGRSWRVRKVPGADSMFFTGAHAIDARTAVLVGTNFAGSEGRIYRTTDGGRTWERRWALAGPGIFLDGLAFWDAQHGIAFGDPVDGTFFVLVTDDGGRTWSRIRPTSLPRTAPGEAAFAASGAAITVAGDSHVWIGTGGASYARVWRSADRGRTWRPYETPIVAGKTAGIFGLAFRDTLHGVAVGGDYQQRASGGVVAVTSDGGRSWRRMGAPAPAGVRYGVATPAPRMVVAVGPSGSGWSCDDGATWTAIDTVGLNAVRAGADGAIWAAGLEGRAVRWRDGFACSPGARSR